MTAPSSILVCRLSALGDIVLTLPVIDALRERFPEARLEYLAREPYGRILRRVAALDALHLWGGPGVPVEPGIRDRRWDVVIDLSVTSRSRRLLRGVTSHIRLGARKETLRRFAFVRLRPLGGGRVTISRAVDRLFAAVSPLGLAREGRVPRFDVPGPPADGPVLIGPGGGRAAKCWGIDRFREVARHLSTEGRRLRLVGSSSEEDRLREIADGADPARTEIIAGADPADLPEVASGCPVALTNDSGLLHVAEACGATVIALFGPTHPRLGFAPLGAGARILHSGIGCSPCDPHGPERCPRRHHRCMTDIDVDRVLAEVRSVAPIEGTTR